MTTVNACAECRYANGDHCLASGSSQFMTRDCQPYCRLYRPLVEPPRVLVTPNPEPAPVGLIRRMWRRFWRWLW